MLKSARGIALVQVLIIAIILSVFGLFISQSLKSQSHLAFSIQDSFDGVLQIENTKAQLIYTLLTERKNGRGSPTNSMAKKWNFFGKPFEVEQGVKVTLQDLRSLISLNITNYTLASNVLASLGVNSDKRQEFLASLADWKDKDDLSRLNGAETSFYNSKGGAGPRNGYLQSLSEVLYVKEADALTLEQWEKYFSVQFVSDFNPLNAPELILKSLIRDESIVEELLKLRNAGQLNSLKFYQLTGIDEDEFLSFTTGSAFRVNIEIEQDNKKISCSFVLDVKPTSILQPVTITNVKWN